MLLLLLLWHSFFASIMAATSSIYFLERLDDGGAITEGTSSQPTTFTIKIRRTNATGTGSVGFRLGLYGSSYYAAADDVIGPTEGRATFEIGETSKTLTFQIAADARIENNELFWLELVDPVNGMVLPGSSGMLQILDDDGVSTLGFSTASTQVTEAVNGRPGEVSFTVTRSSDVGRATVDYVVLFDTATATDFASPTQGTVVFDEGETSRVVTLQLANDTLVEGPESFAVTLTRWSNLTRPDDWWIVGQKTFVLNDDDAAGAAKFSIALVSGYDVPEGAVGNGAQVKLVVRRSDSRGSASVEYETIFESNSSSGIGSFSGMSSPSDLIGATRGLVTFVDGQTSQEIGLSFVGDAVFETDELVTVRLTNPTNGVLVDANSWWERSSVMVRLINDDLPQVSIAPLTDGRVREDGLSSWSIIPYVNLQFVVTRSVAGGETYVPYQIMHGTTDAADFYGDNLSGSIRFDAGQRQAIFSVLVAKDDVVEAAERFSVRLLESPANYTIAGTSTAEGVILDDDSDPTGAVWVQLSPVYNSVNNYTFANPVELDGPTAGPRVIDVVRNTTVGDLSLGYRIVHGTTTDADFAPGALTGRVVIPNGAKSAQIALPIVDDTLAEGSEGFFVHIFDPSDPAVVVRYATHPLTLVDDEPESGLALVEIAAVDTALTEGDMGLKTFNFLARRTGVTQGYASVSWSIRHVDTDDADFQGTSGYVIFSPGVTEQVIPVRVASDVLGEVDERFSVVLSQPYQSSLGALQSADAVILTDDTPTQVRLATRALTTDEGSTGPLPVTLVVTRSSGVGAASVNWSVVHGTTQADDITGVSRGVVSFADGETVKTLTVMLAGDTVAEKDETFSVVLADAEGAQIAADGGSTSVTVRNDDLPALRIALVGDAARAEGQSGQTAFTFNIARDVGFGASTVNWSVVQGTTTAADFSGVLGGTVSFKDGETVKPITVNVVGDVVPEADETFSVRLAGATGATVATSTAVATVKNDDWPTLSIKTDTASVKKAEGAPGAVTPFTFTVTRSSPIGTSSVDWRVAGTATESADFASVTAGTVTFRPGQSSQTVTVQVQGDALVEADELFSVELLNPTGAVLGPAAGSTASATIVNDDWPVLSIVADTPGKAEGQSGKTPFTFTVTRSSSVGTSSVKWAVSHGTTVAADFSGTLNGTLNFADKETTKIISLDVVGDAVVEADETFSVVLSSPVKATLATTSTSAKATVKNDDWPVLSIKTDTASVKKAEGATGAVTPFTFTVSRSSGLGTSSVAWRLGGEAITPTDFASAMSGRIDFAAGQLAQTLTVQVQGDAVVEPDELFRVTLVDPVGATLGAAATTTASATITNDDTHTLAITTATPVLDEGPSGTTKNFAFTVARSSGVGTSTVKWVVEPGANSGVTAADFAGGVLPSGTLTFVEGQSPSQTVVVTVAGDNEVEADEVFGVRLSSPVNATLTTALAQATIRNDDSAGVPAISIVRADAVRAEGHSGSTPYTFTLTRSSAVGTSSVDWQVQPVMADASDFVVGGTAGTVTFLAGQTTQTLTVQVAGDTAVEADEIFTVQLRNPVNATLTTTSIDGTITNDDWPVLSIAASAATQAEGTSGDGLSEFRFTVTRQPAFNYTEVNYRVVHDTTNADDFLANSTTGMVTFADGQSSKPVSIWVRADAVVEPDERFRVELYNPMNGTLLTSTASMVIGNDDVASAAPWVAMAG